MLYHYVTLADGTEISHTELLDDGRIRVAFERINEERDDIDRMEAYFPGYNLRSLVGFTDEQKKELISFFKEHKNEILQRAMDLR